MTTITEQTLDERLESALITLSEIHNDLEASPATRVAAARAIVSASTAGLDDARDKGTSEMTAKELEAAAGQIKRRLKAVAGR